MTGLKRIVHSRDNRGHVSPHPSFKGDTVQFTTGVFGNADHINVAPNGPYHQGPQRTSHFRVIGRMLALRTN